MFGQKTGRQKILGRVIASIASVQSAVNLILNVILNVTVVPKHLSCSTPILNF